MDRRHVDGALLHELRVPFGDREVDDEGDDLDAGIADFRRAVEPSKSDLPAVPAALRQRIEHQQAVRRMCAVQRQTDLAGRIMDCGWMAQRVSAEPFRGRT